jgi:protein tyrosine/serine phosphatase
MTLITTRHVDCDGAYNLRDLGGYRARDGRTVKWRSLWRADGLHRITESSLSVVRDLGWRTVLDLRTPTEVDAGRYCCTGVDVIHLPILRDTWDVEAVSAHHDDAAAFLAERYLEMTESGATAIATAFELLASRQRLPMVFHCSAGKDRTGVLAALVLAALDVDDEQIAIDYHLSAPAMEKLVGWIKRHRPEVAEHMARQPTPFLACPPEAILRFLELLRARHGGVRLYLADIGIERTTLEGVQDALLEG